MRNSLFVNHIHFMFINIILVLVWCGLLQLGLIETPPRNHSKKKIHLSCS
jgi:hypothetical protein